MAAAIGTKPENLNSVKTEDVEKGEVMSHKAESFKVGNHDSKLLREPENPENFSWRKKWLVTVLVLSVGYANSIFASLISLHASKIEGSLIADITNQEDGLNLNFSIFSLGAAIGPIIFAPAAEKYGRVPILRFAGVIYVIINAACGFSSCQSHLFCLRFFGGLAAAAPNCLIQIIVAEIWGKESRGTPLCLNSLIVVIGPCIGNLIGGLTVDKVDWRWIIWITSFISLILHLLVILFLPETRKQQLPSSSQMDGHSKPRTENICAGTDAQNNSTQNPSLMEISLTIGEAIFEPDTIVDPDIVLPEIEAPTNARISREESPTILQHRSSNSRYPFENLVPLPLWIWIYDPLILLLSLQMGMIFFLFYIVQTRIVQLYHLELKETIDISCLHSFAILVGATCASKLDTKGLSLICEKLGIKCGHSCHRPEYKFRCMIPGILLLPLGTISFALTTHHENSWILPDIGIFLLGAGVILGFRKSSSYIIDTFGDHAPSALVAVNFIRRFESFFIPIIVNKYFQNSSRYKWLTIGSSIAALIIVCPMPFFLYTHGHKLRRLPLCSR